MSGEAVYYVRTVRAGRETSAILYGTPVDRLIGKEAKRRGIVFAVRLDIMPGGELLAQQTLERLDAVYERLKAEGNLPASNLVPPTVGDKPERGRQLGEWWAPPAPSWDPKAPGEPFPDPDSLKPRPDAPGAMFGRAVE